MTESRNKSFIHAKKAQKYQDKILANAGYVLVK